MARKAMFDLVMDRILRTEGGWVDHPADRGGETYRGIARTFHPDWRGWGVIDEMKGRRVKGFPECLDDDEFLQAQVRGLYLQRYWTPIGVGLVEEYQCAHRYMDMAVNAGVTGAVRAMQNALRLLGQDPGPTDGVMGPRTGGALRAQGEAREGWTRLDLVLRGLQVRHYVVIAEQREDQRVFLVGWLRRAMS